jgi:hypothetical protein
MNWSKLSSVAEIVSSIAVLVTLVYLTIQLQQNTNALQAGGRDAVISDELELLLATIERPELMLYRVRESLSEEERVQLGSYLVAFVRLRERDWRQFQSGALDAATWASYQGGLISTLSNPQSRRWWGNAAGAFPSDFRNYVSELIADEPIRSQIGAVVQFDQ